MAFGDALVQATAATQNQLNVLQGKALATKAFLRTLDEMLADATGIDIDEDDEEDEDE